MRLTQLDVNLLVALDLLLKERSVTRAARAMGVTQPAMSQTLARLRDQFADPLLTREGNQMTPTPRAEALAGPLAAALRDLEAVVTQEPVFDAATARREFSIGTTDYGALLLVRPLMARLQREAPGVSVRVVPLGGDVARPLEEGEADLVLSVLVGERPQRIRTEVLYHESYRCLVRHDHPLVAIPVEERGRWLEVFCDSAHVLVGRTGRGPGAMDRVLEREGSGLKRRVALRVPYFLAAAPMVQASQLVLTTPSRAALAFASMFRELVVLELPMELPSFAIGALWHARYERDQGLTWLRAVVRDEVEATLQATPSASGR